MEQISFPLFLPALRMDRLAKAAASGADAVILDLEDAVGPAQKDEARAQLQAGLGAALPVPVLVRINARGTPWHDADLAACAALPLAGIMLPKAEAAAACDAAADAASLPVLALIETARGLDQARAIARASARIAFGSIDYAADLGIAHLPHALAHASGALVHAARMEERPAPIAGVTTELRETPIITRDARHALEMGFGGKLLIHPAQIAPARAGFAPDAEEIAWARRVVEAAGDGGAARVDGAMIDAPVIRRAQTLLERALLERALPDRAAPDRAAQTDPAT